MSEAQKLRAKAVHALQLAQALTDERARTALIALAADFQQQATELETEEHKGEERPASRNDTP